MVLKTLKNNSRGSSILEIMLIMAVLAVMMSITYLLINPANATATARDEKRLNDLQTLDRAINEYFIDNESYPGTENTNLVSTSSPSGIHVSSSNGWLEDNLSDYFVKTPVDPLNDLTYYYIYRHSDSSYELNARLENSADTMQNDGGNSNDFYELGNNLSLL